MDNGIQTLRQFEMRLVFIRRLVYGIRYRIDIHVSILAFAGTRREKKKKNTHRQWVIRYLLTVVRERFLFQEVGGSPTLFGFASIINHISEIFAYFWSFKLIRELGHVKVGASHALRFFSDLDFQPVPLFDRFSAWDCWEISFDSCTFRC